MNEEILEPDLPIIDPHHHLWDHRPLVALFPEPRHRFIESILPVANYGFDHFRADLATGHNIIATVFMECSAFYRAYGEEAMKVVGEVEYVNGVAAQSASGLYGDQRLCAGIIGHADLMLGADVAPVLERLQAAAPDRFKGIRYAAAWDADPEVLGPPIQKTEGLYRDPVFRQGFAQLGKLGLSFDAWIVEPQIPDVIDLARAFPDQPICLDHCGTPLGMASYTGKLHERFDIWRHNIHELAKCDNVQIKLGGLAMHNCAMPEEGPAAGVGSDTLAALWRPYIETCIEAFGTRRAMFESNYPVDRWGATYPVLWNAFKRLTRKASADEKADLYAGNAARFYRIEHVLK
ncbi:amidohydrolase family protein [Altererythrobacter sp. GH1-8]|uniref:amidohydrolase family protein n=1 Tax=Altererythrobacter sp. GH1-8 TaxID=3349333 RepID=UPI00374CC0C3